MPWTHEDQDDFEGFTLENAFDGFILEGKSVFKGNVIFFEGNGMLLGVGLLKENVYDGFILEGKAVFKGNVMFFEGNGMLLGVGLLKEI